MAGNAEARLLHLRAHRGGGKGAERGRFEVGGPTGTSASAALQAGWELDVFGGNAAAADAAQARLEGAQAQWHDARVAIAAETASSYLRLRACEAQREQTRIDAESRAETARLTGLAAKVNVSVSASVNATASAGMSTATAGPPRTPVSMSSPTAPSERSTSRA